MNFCTITCKINKSESGKRLDQALTNLIDKLSRSQVKQLIINGNIKKSNVQFYSVTYKVKEGEKYEIRIPKSSNLSHPLPQNIPINIVFEDDDIIVVDKESGMVTHPGAGNINGTLVNALLFHTNNRLSKIGENQRPGIVHRIDKETSGLLVIAKNNQSHDKLSNQFKKHKINRKYKALVWGIPNKKTISGFIGRHKRNRKMMTMIDESRGKYSETSIKIVNNFNICCLIDCELKTGRTHQIRVHLHSIGNPLIGDKKYRKIKNRKIKKNNKDVEKISILRNFNRHALHAYLLGFHHPKNGTYMEYYSNLPEDFSELLSFFSKS